MTLRDGMRQTLYRSALGYRTANELYDQLDTFEGASTAVTATADGLTTGLIPSTASHVTVASGNTAHIVTLPAPVVGKRIRIYVGTTACKIRTVASSNVTINGTDADGVTTQGTLLASGLHELTCVTATAWLGVSLSSAGVTAAIAVA